MSWFEMFLEVECPHCGDTNHEHVEFNMGGADSSGVNSDIKTLDCFSCDKKFWYRAYCNFETEVSSVWKTEPKGK